MARSVREGPRRTYRTPRLRPGRLVPGRRGLIVLGVLVLALAGAYAGLRVYQEEQEPGPRAALEKYLSAWSRGDDRAAARETTNPREAARVLAVNRKGLDGARVKARVLSLRTAGGAGRARLRVDWTVPTLGSWGYETDARLRQEAERWRVDWRPTIVHPFVDGIARLGTIRDPAERGSLEDRRGKRLVTQRAVTQVGMKGGDARGVDRTAAALASVIDIDAKAFADAVRAAPEGQFVEAIVLRRADYKPKAARLRAIDGVLTQDGTRQLAPSRDFARALLGAVAPITEEQLERLGDAASPGDEIGQTGLQAAVEKRVAGSPSRRIVLRVDDAPRDTLTRLKGKPGEDVRTTLGMREQRAAEAALGARKDEAALVVVKPSTGDILAVANRPADSTYDRAIEGRYPPGSTFKVVSTAALLRDGLRPSDVVDCPKTIEVGGRPFRNFEGGAGGSVPFTVDFEQSCNTAFAGLAERLGADDLRKTARDYGLGEPLKLPVKAPRASVPKVDDAAARAASMIGQERILASPLSMAGVAATVAAGRWHAPRLLADDPRRAGRRLSANERTSLRSLMRRVVTSGTGVALKDVPGEVRGKSGTAEFGNENPPRTHAWFIAHRGDIALAVLVENGKAGGAVAAPIAAKFFRSLGRG
ncbi:MAG: Cell division protein FtsI [Peptidoglycan synthetase] [uncultured Solirubrobacteraceae bacterium]|uniref:Cell division protein FtsI [Peptidoglycan synthetase] n=1 Tax=uncultured Solirubrobacteraceae bacterium TaxID=1162706 RepID=A0A6J4U232_9ACTN|nr:MAG: Cell division protein FtsI [Peptidoglycan synthetase] [uncultured Solirubrobacteraceae bacterium]